MDYIPTIPPLIRRGVSKSEHVSESFKLFLSKHFGEDVCNLIFLSHTISFVASAAATYSASVVESARTDCLRDLHETAADPKLIVYP